MNKLLGFKKITSTVALLLAAAMLFSGCGSKNTASNGSSGSDVVINNESEDGSLAPDNGNAENNGSSKTGGKNGTTGNKNSSKSGGSKNTKTTFDKDIYGNIPADVKSKEVHVLMWRKYLPNEQKAVDDFQKKTGIKVRTTITTEDQYTTKLISLISGKDSPDVVSVGSKNFPGLITRSMQSVDAATFKLDDSCWYKPFMDAYKINGKYFGVAMDKTLSCHDTTFVTYYLESVLRTCGVTTMPYDLYKQGKWNWDTQREIATKVQAKGSAYTGISVQNQDVFMLSTGTDFVSYNNGKFSNTISEKGVLDGWRQLATMSGNGCLRAWDLNATQQGKVGLFTAITYGMSKEAAFFKGVAGGFENVRAVPVAGPTQGSAYTPVRPKLWGVAKGAKNAAGAAYFLRYFLDVKNIDFDGLFINSQCKEVYNIVTASSTKRKLAYAYGILDYVKKNNYYNTVEKLAQTTAANINTTLNSYKGTVTTNVNRANKDLERVK